MAKKNITKRVLNGAAKGSCGTLRYKTFTFDEELSAELAGNNIERRIELLKEVMAFTDGRDVVKVISKEEFISGKGTCQHDRMRHRHIVVYREI